MVAEALRRKWACIELSSEYIRGGLARFQIDRPGVSKSKPATYTINTPCSQPVGDREVPLVANGGSARVSGPAPLGGAA